MPASKTTKRGLTFRDGLWLGFALFVHASLFLIPIREFKPPTDIDDPEVVEIQLIAFTEKSFVDQVPEENVLPAAPPEPPLPTEEIIEAPPEPQAELAEQEDLEPVTEPDEQQEPTTTSSAAILMQSAVDLEWPQIDSDQSRTLGVHVPQGVPKNWLPKIIVEDNRFDGMTVPREVEILDRWISNDGAHNVVLNTPNGETLCGRALAWDPMQPLVEHVMQFRPCAGGGKRTFEMPHRYHKSAREEGLVNSTTN